MIAGPSSLLVIPLTCAFFFPGTETRSADGGGALARSHRVPSSLTTSDAAPASLTRAGAGIQRVVTL